MKHYSTEEGLPSNSIKDVIQDNKGFIWIATDAGIARYNNLMFEVFNEELQFSYVKDLYFYKDNGVIITTDLGIDFCHSSGETEKITSIIQGGTDESDSLVYYPKNVFIDSKNRMWISETNHISMKKEKTFKKYKFEPMHFTNDYKRSYTFVEDLGKNLIAASWKGYIFYFNEKINKFERISFDQEGSFFIHCIKYIDGQLYIGTFGQNLLTTGLQKI